jgi:hypothetical protein
MRHWTIEVSERELRAILSAMDLARDQTANDGWRWWHETKYADRLYFRLRGHGIEELRAALGE